MIFILLIFIGMTPLLSILEFSLKAQNRIQELSIKDEKLAHIGEKHCGLHNKLLRINQLIQAQYLLCPAALSSGQVPLLKASVHSLALSQKSLIFFHKKELFSKFLKERLFIKMPQRGPPQSPCLLKGLLFWRHKKLLEIKSSFSGIVAFWQKKQKRCEWSYENSRVLPL